MRFRDGTGGMRRRCDWRGNGPGVESDIVVGLAPGRRHLKSTVRRNFGTGMTVREEDKIKSGSMDTRCVFAVCDLDLFRESMEESNGNNEP